MSTRDGASSSFLAQAQHEIKQDWDNRELQEVIGTSIKKMAEFLNHFDVSCRTQLAQMNEKLTRLEKQVDIIETQVNRSVEVTSAGVDGGGGQNSMQEH